MTFQVVDWLYLKFACFYKVQPTYYEIIRDSLSVMYFCKIQWFRRPQILIASLANICLMIVLQSLHNIALGCLLD